MCRIRVCRFNLGLMIINIGLMTISQTDPVHINAYKYNLLVCNPRGAEAAEIAYHKIRMLDEFC